MGAGVMRRGADPVIMVLLGLAAVLLLTNLGNGVLWEDEAETAVLARNSLHAGYPVTFDGRTQIEIQAPYRHGPGGVWIYSPWLPFYLLGGFFRLFGESTTVARLPFALCGWLAVFATWRFARRVIDDRLVQRLCVALLAFSVPFLLHARQSRYYALALLLVVAICSAYHAVLRAPSAKRAAGLAAALALLFHTTFGTFFPIAGAIAAHQAWRRKREEWRVMIPTLGVVALLCAPWLLLFSQQNFIGSFSWERMADHLQYYVRITNKYLIPLALMAASGIAVMVLRWKRPGRLRWTLESFTGFLVLAVVFQFLFLATPDPRHMRYFLPVLPILLLWEARWLAAAIRRLPIAGWTLAALALFTNVLQSPHPQVPLVDLVYELTHQYVGPMDGVVSYLQAHAQPGQTVKIPFDERTLIFYTPLSVEPLSTFQDESFPDWIVIRRNWLPKRFFTSAYFKRIEERYNRIELDAPDLYWQNRENPGDHRFRTALDAPRVLIYRKRSGPAG